MILLDVEGGPSNELDKKIVQLQQEVALIEEEIKEKVNLLNNWHKNWKKLNKIKLI